jgi:nitrogenase iron protein NifH
VELFKQQRIFKALDLDFVIYDEPGDAVCGGFTLPIGFIANSLNRPYAKEMADDFVAQTKTRCSIT